MSESESEFEIVKRIKGVLNQANREIVKRIKEVLNQANSKIDNLPDGEVIKQATTGEARSRLICLAMIKECTSNKECIEVAKHIPDVRVQQTYSTDSISQLRKFLKLNSIWNELKFEKISILHMNSIIWRRFSRTLYVPLLVLFILDRLKLPNERLYPESFHYYFDQIIHFIFSLLKKVKDKYHSSHLKQRDTKSNRDMKSKKRTKR